MAGLDDHAAEDPREEPEQISVRSTRYGRMLFVAYAVLYAGFMLLNAFAPEKMQTTLIAGINLAVLYGLALIVVAFFLAVFYDWLCRVLTRQPQPDDEVRP